MTNTQSSKQPPSNTIATATGFGEIEELGDRIAALRTEEARELMDYFTILKGAKDDRITRDG